MADEVEVQLEGYCAQCAQSAVCRPLCERLAKCVEQDEENSNDGVAKKQGRQWKFHELLHEELARPFRATSRVAQAHAALLLLQRELMTLARVFVSDVVVRQLVMLVICLAAIIWQVWVLPYESKGTNLAQTVLLFSLFVITAAGFPGAIYGGVLDSSPSAAKGNTRRDIETLFGIDQASATSVVVAADVVIAGTMLLTFLFLVVMAGCYVRLSCGWKLPRCIPRDSLSPHADGRSKADARNRPWASADGAREDRQRAEKKREKQRGEEGEDEEEEDDDGSGFARARSNDELPAPAPASAEDDDEYHAVDGGADEGDAALRGPSRFSLQRMATSVLGALAPAGGENIRFQRE
jgi:hypothetical protein